MPVRVVGQRYCGLCEEVKEGNQELLVRQGVKRKWFLDASAPRLYPLLPETLTDYVLVHTIIYSG